jgi:hypothetical protein
MYSSEASQQLFFDPDKHPEDTLKAFQEFIQTFELRYHAQYPDPPKVSLDSAVERWKVANTTESNPQPKPTLDQYDKIRDEWQAKDKVAKFLGMFSSRRFYSDWQVAEPDESIRNKEKWPAFVRKIQEFYKPTDNPTLKNFHFRALTQQDQESFPAFCNRVEKEARHCRFNCDNENCSAEKIAVRDQIVIGTHNNKIREEALKLSWDLATLRRECMRMESALRGGAEITGESVNRLGKYSYAHMKKKDTGQRTAKRTISCYNCGNQVTGQIMKPSTKGSMPSTKCEIHQMWQSRTLF